MPAEALAGTTLAAGVILSGAGATVVTIESLRRRPLRSSVLVQRWLTWTVLSVLWLLGLSHPIALVAVLSVVGTASAREYVRLARLRREDKVLLTTLPTAVLAALTIGATPGVVLLVVVLGTTLPALLTQDIERGPDRIGRLLVGVAVAVIPSSAIWMLGTQSTGLLLALLFGVALSDVLAFTVGSISGGRRLAPVLSPNKTWSGVAGNVIGATAGVAIAGIVTNLDPRIGVVAAIAIAVGSVWGDLFESLLKRSAGVKDAGSVLPGFGGVLDRFDSLVVAAPLLWVMAQTMGAWQ